MSDMEVTNSVENESQSSSEAESQSEPKGWSWADGVQGQGERPDWLKPKYQSVADQAKAFIEAEKRLGGFTGAPEKYDLLDLDLDENQFLVQELVSVGKELNMNQDGLKKILGRLVVATQTEDKLHLETEVKKLGPDGERILKTFENWTKTHLSPEEAEVTKSWIRSADDLKVFDKLRAHTNISAIPTGNSMRMSNPFENAADVKAEMAKNLEKYDKDKTYRENLKQRLHDALERERR